jgi:hypothetical protein
MRAVVLHQNVHINLSQRHCTVIIIIIIIIIIMLRHLFYLSLL